MKKQKRMSIAQLKKKYEPIIRDILKRRDGNMCQIRGTLHACDGPLVADHRPIGRGQGNACFFDSKNLTIVCSKANFLAQNHAAVSHAIIDVVKLREGGDIVERLYEQKRKPFTITEDYVLSLVALYKAKWPEPNIIGRRRK